MKSVWHQLIPRDKVRDEETMGTLCGSKAIRFYVVEDISKFCSMFGGGAEEDVVLGSGLFRHGLEEIASRNLETFAERFLLEKYFVINWVHTTTKSVFTAHKVK